MWTNMRKRRIIVSITGIVVIAMVMAFAAKVSAAVVLDPAAVRAAAIAAGFTSLDDVSVQQVNNLDEFLNPGPGAKSMAVVMGKALFWDMQVGSSGQACATCHFDAGVDGRTKNQLNPGQRAVTPDNTFGNSAVTGVVGWPQFKPNYNLTTGDFPFLQLADPQKEDYNHRAIVHDTNDVVSSQGVFKTNFTGILPGQLADNGTAVADPVFKVGDVNVRQIPPRNAPSVINAVFNFDNFWDGRAENRFNGVNPLGPLDANATILVTENGTPQARRIVIPNSSLASQATGPPLSDVEMSFAGRTFPDIGKKMLAARPLSFQEVHAEDSILGPYSRIGQPSPNNKGLTFTTYAEMVQVIFRSKYWNSTNVITFNSSGSQVINPPGTPGGYTMMEANFSLFFGLAIQAHESTLVSDETRFDRFMNGDNTILDQDELAGLLTFINVGTPAQKVDPLYKDINQGACIECHRSATFSDATFSGMGIEGPIELEFAPIILDGRIKQGTEIILLDNGYYNIGVRPLNEDLGRGGSELGIPLSVSKQALQGLSFAPRLPTGTPGNPRVFADGAFKVPGLRNVELTAPYFHTGSYRSLRQVVDFYRRQGDFGDVNINSLDSPLALVQLPRVDMTSGIDRDGDRLIKFLLTLTDERVRNEAAPFDHPQLFVPNGHPGNSDNITQFTLVNGIKQANDIMVELPALGRNGRTAESIDPITPFLDSGAIQGLTVRLIPGWNTLATPIRLHSTSDTWSEFTARNGLNYQVAYTWNGTAFQFVDPAYVLTPLDAVFVLMNTMSRVEFIPYEGVSAPPGKTLNPGWNLVGSAFLLSEMPVKDAMVSVYFVPTSPSIPNAVWGYNMVVSPTTNTFTWTYVRDAPTIPSMEIGQGYWVSMVNSGQLNGFTSTPWPPR